MQISKIKKILNRCACSKKLEFFHGWLRSSCAILSSPSFCSTEWPLMLLFLLNGMLVYYKMLSYSFFKFLCQFSGTIYLFYFMKPIQVVFWIVQYSRENFVHVWRATVSGKDPQGVGLKGYVLFQLWKWDIRCCIFFVFRILLVVKCMSFKFIVLLKPLVHTSWRLEMRQLKHQWFVDRAWDLVFLEKNYSL